MENAMESLGPHKGVFEVHKGHSLGCKDIGKSYGKEQNQIELGLDGVYEDCTVLAFGWLGMKERILLVIPI